MARKPIYVTRPSLPGLDELLPYLESIWSSGQLTNMGPYHIKLEKSLRDMFSLKHLSLFNNGTIALLVAQKALGMTGEVITTPYTFAATAHSLVWNGLKPVFVDVEPLYLNLDPEKIEEVISSSTSALLPVHVYGNPCNCGLIEQIAQKHGLKVLYDGSHAFGTEIDGESVLGRGDMTVMSFHATKVFNTFEGGAVISSSEEMQNLVNRLKNFGFRNEITITEFGINGKMNEFQSAIGLLQLNEIDSQVIARELIAKYYYSRLKDIPGIRMIETGQGVSSFYPYFPIFVNEEIYGKGRDYLVKEMNNHEIFPRRYFYPLLTDLEIYKPYIKPGQSFPVASRAASEVLCLPLYAGLDMCVVNEIIDIIGNQSE